MSGVMLKTSLIKVRFLICLLDQKLPHCRLDKIQLWSPPFPFLQKTHDEKNWERIHKHTSRWPGFRVQLSSQWSPAVQQCSPGSCARNTCRNHNTRHSFTCSGVGKTRPGGHGAVIQKHHRVPGWIQQWQENLEKETKCHPYTPPSNIATESRWQNKDKSSNFQNLFAAKFNVITF